MPRMHANGIGTMPANANAANYLELRPGGGNFILVSSVSSRFDQYMTTLP